MFHFSDVKMVANCAQRSAGEAQSQNSTLEEVKGDVVVHVDPTPWKANFAVYLDRTLVTDYSKFVYGVDKER